MGTATMTLVNIQISTAPAVAPAMMDRRALAFFFFVCGLAESSDGFDGGDEAMVVGLAVVEGAVTGILNLGPAHEARKHFS